MGHIEPSDQHRWFAFRVKSNCEARCSTLLRHKCFETFVPCYKTFRRRRGGVVATEVPLFSRYIFCRCRWTSRYRPADTASVLTTPGIISVVAFGNAPAPIDDFEIETIQRVVNSELAAQPWPYLQIGNKVRIHSGPLKGVEGVLVSEGGTSRLVVTVSLVQRSVAVAVDRESVSPLDSAHKLIGAMMRAQAGG